MKNVQEGDPAIRDARRSEILAAGCLLIVVIGWILVENTSRKAHQSRAVAASAAPRQPAANPTSREERWRRRFGAGQAQTAEQVVAAKLADFSRKRLEWVRAKSLRSGVDVPREVEEFFKAVERGKWDEIKAAGESLSQRSGQYEHSTHWAELDPFWPAVLETYGAAEQVHDWPAEKLLEYGYDILGSLKPGMVYLGGTDPGRFIPTFLNQTSEGEQHIILTQNALADSRYLEYAGSLYGDHFSVPTSEDSRQIFEQYVADAQKRLEHDQQFPNEPKQIRPGEQVEMVDGKLKVSGQVAVMTINEKLVQWIMERNPGVAFAVEESLPMRSTYAGAVPLGPIMQIDGASSFQVNDAAETVDHWRDLEGALQGTPPGEDDAVLKTYAKMAAAQANVLASRNFPEQAEAAYKLASEIFPRSADATMSYAQFLFDAGRSEEARRTLANFSERNPDLAKDLKPGLVLTRELKP